MRTIIRNAFIVTVDPDLGNIDGCDLLIVDDRIEAIGKSLDVSDAHEIDGTDFLVMPGFVDAHRHIWQGAMRGVCADWSLFNYLGGIRMNAAAAYGPDDMYAAQLHGALEAIDAGVTTVTDYCHNINSQDHAHEAIRGVKESGLRVIWNFGFNRPPVDRPGFSTLAERSDFARQLAKTYFTGKDDLVTMGVAPEESVLWPGTDTAKVQFDLARELGARIFWHCNALTHNGTWMRDVAAIREMGLLGDDMVLVHMHFTQDDEWRMVADAGAAVAYTPDTELQMGMQWPRTQKARSFGIVQGYGADITSNNSDDLFFPLRAALQIERCRINEAHEGGMYDGVPISSAEALRWGTIDGAKALGLDSRVGSLTPGKQADIVMLRMDSLSMTGWPRDNPEGTVLLQASVKDVDTVFVAGRKMKENGKMLGDVERAKRLLLAAHHRVRTAVEQRGGFYVPPDKTIDRMEATRSSVGAR
ncbi:MAG: amidohydrolase family protein [Sphingomonadaceae bacterium]|nr:amidohydrolase family protein [Sphingobium sp.]MBP9158952.1 amidohydrolase family protein [Sphingobium sp.]MCC6482430.1 amidohydrolase family protein [Sphingomonadaceae bacterium]